MMRNPEQTIGNLIDKANMSIVNYIDDEGYPISKAMLPPREREGDTMYYREGVTDPDYCVLRFTAEKGRYYSNFNSEDFNI